ncbi:MAG: 3'-5' exonuclease [Clostridia bacterium]
MQKNEIIELRKKVLNKFFIRMNDVQKQAIFKTDGALLILAGAGSGKTTVVVNRIANLIKFGCAYTSDYINTQLEQSDIDNMQDYLNDKNLSEQTARRMAVRQVFPWKVMAITFTNKAAKELKERLVAMLGTEGEDVWASTFHSSCARMLRKDADRLGYNKSFTIYDTSDSKAVMKRCLKTLDINEKNMPVKVVLSEISKAKDSLIDANEYIENARSDYRLQMIGKLYREYQQELKRADAMDFDDLIVNTVKLLKENPDVLDYYQNRFEHIMVDEYQDTNQAQYQFIKLLADKKQNICVVGDDDQSIYKFRGATIENILNFEENFDNAITIRLEQNYRSTGNILKAANELIANNSQRKGKNLWTKEGEGELITVYTSFNEQDEAEKISDEILKLVGNGKNFSDCAILYRMNSQSLTFERMFAKQGIPHKILGGTRFYDRAEIKDVLSYLHVINNPEDSVRFRRIINTPTRGIGAKSIENLDEVSSQLSMNYLSVINSCEDFPILSKSSKKLKTFGSIINELIDFSQNTENSINDLYLKVLELSEYLPKLKEKDPEKAEGREENILEFSSNIQRYEKECIEQEREPSLSEFLEEISLIADIDNYDKEVDAVTLMTIHSSKGLEFPVVFLPGWEENVFPGASAIYNSEEIEEERRLAYVAITRARENLYIYNTKTRMIFGSTSRNRSSRFVREIPDDITTKNENEVQFSFPQTSNPISYGKASSQMPSFSANKKPSNFEKNTETFKTGDTVKHNTFGQGLILSTRPMGNDTLLEVAFEVGTKMLGANFAKLTKI